MWGLTAELCSLKPWAVLIGGEMERRGREGSIGHPRVFSGLTRNSICLRTTNSLTLLNEVVNFNVHKTQGRIQTVQCIALEANRIGLYLTWHDARET